MSNDERKSCEHGVRHPHPCDDCLDRDIPVGKRIQEHPCYGLSFADPNGLSHRNSWPLSQKDHPYCARCGTEIEGPNNQQKHNAPLFWEPRDARGAEAATRITELEAELATVRAQNEALIAELSAERIRNGAIERLADRVRSLVTEVIDLERVSAAGAMEELAGAVDVLVPKSARQVTPQDQEKAG